MEEHEDYYAFDDIWYLLMRGQLLEVDMQPRKRARLSVNYEGFRRWIGQPAIFLRIFYHKLAQEQIWQFLWIMAVTAFQST